MRLYSTNMSPSDHQHSYWTSGCVLDMKFLWILTTLHPTQSYSIHSPTFLPCFCPPLVAALLDAILVVEQLLSSGY